MGIVAAKVGRNMLNGRSPLATQGNLISVVVAAADLEPGHEITSVDVKTVHMPLEAVPKGGFANGTEVEGRVVTSQVVAGQAVLDPVLAPKGVGRGASSLVPMGMRAVSVDVSESTAVGGLLLPGCHVDIICTMSEEKTGMKVTRTIVENANILAVGQRMSSAAPAAAPGVPEAPMARTITMLVSPKEAEAIELATSLGRARLVLRGGLDKETGVATGMTIGELLGMSDMGNMAIASPTTQSSRLADSTTRPSQGNQQKWTMEVFKDGVRSQQQVDQPRFVPTEITHIETGPVSSKSPNSVEHGARTSVDTDPEMQDEAAGEDGKSTKKTTPADPVTKTDLNAD